ncbi:uncharacterized protein C2orf42 [Chrysoperla carnea]|uniref:uncharacterized protein C2orf42 n=1 Tax=Chrysoperla carnea TaxID=189513 RepID=UPI001D075327|nr:uncharacterized protein C2orf42 [Chrysoperla carnea]
MSNDDKLKSVFADLGRATLRGIRKCPKCGTFNGTRGVSCKNKKCDVVFKEIGLKRKLSSDAVKLLTGTTTQVYSVRVRDRAPDHRGFVQLPYIQTHLTSIDLDPTINLINESAALCFVDTCQRSFNTSILKCHESEQHSASSISSCTHVLAAIKCANEATPLIVRNSILSSLNVSNEIKQELWLLATETVGPLVQRVSKNILAVKCQTSPKHPLGYLHLSFIQTKNKERLENKFFCGCTDFGKGHFPKDDLTNFGGFSKKCIHYYACVCAFASDANLSEEFDYYVNQEKPFISTNLTTTVDVQNLTEDSEDVNESLVSISSIFNTDFITTNNVCNIEVLTEENLMDVSDLVVAELGTIQNIEQLNNDAKENSSNEITIIKENLDDDILNLTELTENYNEVFSSTIDSEFIEISELKRPAITPQTLKSYSSKKPKLQASNNSTALTLTDDCDILKLVTSNENSNMKANVGRKSKKPNTFINSVEEKNVSLSFLEWLASVTETINETMHFQADGKPEPLKFMVSKTFFECFRDRLSLGLSKKRLPNFIKTEIRTDKPPFGTYSKHIWHITNIFHLKKIFETPLVSLEITRSFVKNKDGTYSPCNMNKEEVFCYNNSYVPIKPLELKTFLKVGNTSMDQSEPTPFIIEWIPDIIPKMQIGELKLQFEFGHSRELKTFGQDKVSGSNRKRKNNPKCIRQVKSYCEDVVYGVYNGQVKTSKHIVLGMSLKSLTSSRKIIDVIHRYGHCISYPAVEELETEATYTSIQQSSICPEAIVKSPHLCTGVAFDNFDRFVETNSGKDTLHDTVGIIYQNIDLDNPDESQLISLPAVNNETPLNSKTRRRRTCQHWVDDDLSNLDDDDSKDHAEL